ncbi:MAG: phosphomannomutase/phosphoglucomutase [Deltaproteobacteria bacterium]|nr:phosphomannomutase/phosphoglucomutase [Deltaproteobacteria bacterium]
MNIEVFREYDVRGVVNQDLTNDFVFDLGRAIGTYAAEHDVKNMTVGRDCRLSSESYKDALSRGLTASGIDVVDIGLCATPMLYYSIRHLGTGGGVMITGSHNPPEFNGFKICIGPDTIYGDDIQELRRIMENSRYRQGAGAFIEKSISQSYENELFGNVNIAKNLNVIIDSGNGVAGLFMMPLLKRFGCRATGIYCEPDGHFPHHFPDPTIPEHLQDLIGLVKKEEADCGIAYDGDADRLGVITDKGEILWGDQLLLLFARYVLKENPGAAIIGEVKCSQILYDDIQTHGGRPIMWKAGHSLIKGKMKDEHALLAGEMSGHIFFADRYFGYDDAIYASLRLLEILSFTGKKISELIADIPKTFTTPEIRVDCPDHIKFKIVDELKGYFKKTRRIIDIDGVRIPYADGWGLIRSSNTQPVLVLRFEALTEERLKEIRREIESVLNEIMDRLVKA